uniref:BPI2 domain-containing protein n=2 Tax=Caenorhabditis japonica TaxID=281687 RepID=A0A8R1IPP3_CAEJA
MLAPKISDESNNQTLIDGQGESRQAYWGVDLSVNHPPTFTDEDMIIGFDGGILFNGWKSESAHQPHVLNKTRLDKKMVGILLSDYIPNTLFHHIYMYDLGNFRQRYTPSSLPKILQKLSKAVCSKCYVEISANLTDQPRFEIDGALGARLQLSANVSVVFNGRERLHDVLHAYTKLHVTLKPTVRQSRIFGDVSLTSVDVNVFDAEMARMPSLILALFVFNVLAENGTEHQPAGIYVRLNQKAVDYVADLASDALPAILNNLSPPDIVTEMATISKLHISNVAKPNISAKFIEGKGVAYNVSLASFRASAYASINVFVWSYEGDFTAELRELSIESQLQFDYNGTTTVT